jgi:ATP phosphoribosyltransferase
MIKIALPNKGVLLEPTLEMLSSCGYRVSKSLRSLSSLDEPNGVEFFFLRPGDIPVYVLNGILDAGITGKDFIHEKWGYSPTPVFNYLNLDYGQSKLCLAIPEGVQLTSAAELKGARVATSFPNIVKKQMPDVKIVVLEGAVEIAIKLGIADAIVDIVETGTTLKQADLKVIGSPLFESCAVLFPHPGKELSPEVLVLQSRLKGKMVARSYMMVEYDVPQAKLGEACKLTPGIESPTVAPLQEKGWFSVKAVVKKEVVNSIMDQLLSLGCKGILLTTIESARI